MSNSQLWKYCTKEQCQDFILSLDLVPHSAGMSREKQLACLYMLSNRGAENYHKEILTKKDGGTRTLMVPCSLLKAVQRNICTMCWSKGPYRTAPGPIGKARTSWPMPGRIPEESRCSSWISAIFLTVFSFPGLSAPPSRIRCFLRPPPRFWQTCAAAGNACPRALRLLRPSPIW